MPTPSSSQRRLSGSSRSPAQRKDSAGGQGNDKHINNTAATTTTTATTATTATTTTTNNNTLGSKRGGLARWDQWMAMVPIVDVLQLSVPFSSSVTVWIGSDIMCDDVWGMCILPQHLPRTTTRTNQSCN